MSSVMRSLARLSIMVFVLLAAHSAVSFAADSLCVQGPPQPVDPRFANELRPTPTAQCPYGLDELIERLTKLSINKNAVDSVETVEKAFDIPEMTTTYDAPRIANYSTILTGKGGWKLLVWVREAFFPLNKGPDRFVPGLRPKRLYSARAAQLIVNLNVLGLSPSIGSVQCIPVSPFVNALAKAGWKGIEMLGPGPTDGGRRTPVFQYKDKIVDVLGQPGECAQYFYLGQAPGKH